MISEGSLSVPLDGWERSERPHAWENRHGDTLSIHHFALAPDLPCSLTSMTPIREHYRKLLGSAGGIVEAEPILVSELSCLRVIVKVRQTPNGIAYIASLTLPFRDCSLVVKVQCPELGMTGIRDTVVSEKLLSKGSSIRHADPYAPRYRNATLRSSADDAEWDALFPGHPLSRARSHLSALEQLSASKEVRALPPFERSAPRSFFGRLFGGA
ncbi:MAG: hypothetical protein QM756_28490 [Polyangiaceae bacterium]